MRSQDKKPKDLIKLDKLPSIKPMKRAIIIHCWGGYPEYCWYPQTKNDLESLGFEVVVPLMPDSEIPRLKPWLEKLTELASEPDKELWLIGHSVGCITILRYLETLSEDIQIAGVILVAGFVDDLGYMESVEEKDILPDFFQTSINFDYIKTKARKFIVIHSDNDPYVELRHADVFKEKLNAQVIVKKGAGHFSGKVDDEESCTRLPEVATNLSIG